MLEPLGEGRPLDQFKDKGTHAVEIFDAIDRADMRMVQRGEHPRLAIEAGASLGIVEPDAREDLDGHITIEAAVAGAIDLAHAAFAKQGVNGERSEALPAHVGGEGYSTPPSLNTSII